MKNEDDRHGILVMKFGGTSVGTVDAMRQAARIVVDSRMAWPKTVVVVSALAGVTNLLLESAAQAAQGDSTTYQNAAREFLTRHNEIANELVLNEAARMALKNEIRALVNEFTQICQAVVVLGEATNRALDTITAFGERMSARVMAAVLTQMDTPSEAVDASYCIVTDDQYQSANPELGLTREKTRQRLLPALAAHVTPVVTGFISATKDGVTTTLGRGGSDYSAAILADALDASEVWIWTDVDGVMTADPRLIPEARTIPTLTYREISELAYFGAKVLHPKTIRPVIERGIKLRVCNTFAPEKPGTYLVAGNGGENASGDIKAITNVRGLQLVTVEGRGMLGVPGVAGRTFHAVAKTGTSVPLITQASSEQSICFAVPKEAAPDVLKALKKEFAVEIERNDIDRVWVGEEVVILTVVGEGMRYTPGIAGRTFSALGAEKVNVIAIAQGSSEVSISTVIDAREALHALRALHALIKVDEVK